MLINQALGRQVSVSLKSAWVSLEASLGQPRLHEMLPQKEQTQFILTTCDTDVNYFSNIRIGLITSYL